VDAAVVDAVLTASRSLIAVAARSLGAAAEETTIAQGRQVVDQATARRRVLIEDILARLPVDTRRAVAGALAAFADAAGEVPDSQWPPTRPAGEAAWAGLDVSTPPRGHVGTSAKEGR
jgi:hypothetical protein